MMDWRIPVAMLLGAAVTGGVFHMVDPDAYPRPDVRPAFRRTHAGRDVHGHRPGRFARDAARHVDLRRADGLLTVLIRFMGGLAEGVMYAILLGNALSPLIDNLTQPRTYGETQEERCA